MQSRLFGHVFSAYAEIEWNIDVKLLGTEEDTFLIKMTITVSFTVDPFKKFSQLKNQYFLRSREEEKLERSRLEKIINIHKN